MSEQSEHKRPKFRIDVIALFTALATAVVGYYTVRVAHEDSVKTMQLSNRPYVSAQGSLVIGKVDERPAATVTLHLIANGTSPALDTVFRRRCVAADTAQRIENGDHVIVPPDVWNRLDPTVSHSVIFPNNGLDFHCVAFLDLPPPSPYVFAVGNITYTDVFGESHNTTFCFENSAQAHSESSPMLPCSTGNKMD
jgi:hypothetical protein